MWFATKCSFIRIEFTKVFFLIFCFRAYAWLRRVLHIVIMIWEFPSFRNEARDLTLQLRATYNALFFELNNFQLFYFSIFSKNAGIYRRFKAFHSILYLRDLRKNHRNWTKSSSQQTFWRFFKPGNFLIFCKIIIWEISCARKHCTIKASPNEQILNMYIY